MQSDNNNLSQRLFEFSIQIISLVREFPKGKEYDIISYQLIKSATSSGANYSPCQIVSNYG
ncbi:four helix bundle protein [Candidatus Sulfidibacterium hydrothermale]|uniref:four helix bundle protein n=1 Tax=Candidatus Sulfidibacterium hydrothermale TaxID=2875962 RepID=UPI001F0A40A3|nr:four helix bundle protein [Candidatus Sulfidibacterium hydrothermale]